MRNNKTTKKIQRGIALAAITSFLIMPVNLAWSTTITGTTTGGQVNLNGSGDIGYGGVGTGVGHFGQFDITRGDTVNLTGAQRYINMVDQKVNINGTLNALRNGGGGAYANTIFIAPDGMVVGANGIMNVAGLQMITPTKTDYNSLVGKGLNNITFDDAKALAGGGNGVLSVDGKIYSAGDVVFSAGGGIFMDDGTLIRTTAGADATENGLGNISMFTNTGSIGLDGYTDKVVIDSAGNLTFNASNGGVGASSGKNALPINVKVAEGKTLNVTVSDEECPNALSRTGVASINNKGTDNLKLGTIKGNHITISNEGTGEMTTTEAITDVTKIYLNAKNGKMNLSHDIEAKDNIRLNGKNQAKTTGNLKVANNGYVSVYSENGDVDIADVTIKQGNVDIKSKKGNVSHGNITISERGKYSDYTRLRDNSKVETFVGAPDTFRTDGVAITANGNITQKAGTKINSAGRVDMVAGGSVNHTVKAADLINVQAGNQAKLATLGTARLGDVSGATVDVTGSDIIIDGKVKGSSKVDINATDKVTIRPRTKLDSTHNTYGAIEATGDINVTAANGITATEQRPEGAMITSTAGSVTLDAKAGDIKTNASDAKITVSAANEANAKGKNIFLRLMHNDGGVGTIAATGDATIVADGDMNVSNKISAQKLTATANNNIKQSASGEAFVSTGDMTLKSNNGNVGMPDGYLTVNVGGALDANAAKGGVYINSNNDLNATNVVAGTDAALKSGKKVTATNITAGNNVTVDAADAVTIANAKSGKNMNLKSKNADVNAKVDVGGELDASGNNVTINTDKDLTIGAIAAANDATIKGAKNIKKGSKATSVTTGKNLKITSTGADIGASDKALTVDVGGTMDASAANGSVYINSGNDLNVATVTAKTNASLKSSKKLTANSVTATNGYVELESADAMAVANAKSGKNMSVKSTGSNVTVSGLLDAGEALTVNAKGNIAQTVKGQKSFKSGKNMTLTSSNGNVGAADKYLNVESNGTLTATATAGNVYIAGTSADNANITAGQDIEVGNFVSNKSATLNAGKNVAIADVIEAKENLSVTAKNNITQKVSKQTSFKSGKDMTLTSTNGNVGIKSDNHENELYVDAKGSLTGIAENGGVYIHNPQSGKDVYIKAKDDLKFDNVYAPRNATLISTAGNVDIVKKAEAKNDLTIAADGYIHQATDGQTTFVSGKNMSLTSDSNNVGDPAKYLQVQVGGELDADAPQGGVYIGSKEDLTLGRINAGENAEIIGVKNIKQGSKTPAITTGKNLTIKSETANVGAPDKYLTVNVGNLLDADAPNGGVYIYAKDSNLKVANANAGQDLKIKADGTISQKDQRKTTFFSGKDMELVSTGADVGIKSADHENELYVDAKGSLKGVAENGGVYIHNPKSGKDVYIKAKDDLKFDNVYAPRNATLISTNGNIDIVDQAKADNNLTLEAGGYVHQATPDKVTFVSGKDMTFKSNNDNVGDPNLYLQVDVGGKLDAAAPKGGVYIGSPKDLVVGKVAAGHDVEIVTEGNLHQTPTGGPRPAITAGDSMLLISKTGDVGDPNNWLTVDVGGNGADKSKITAIAANEDEGKDVYIWAKNRPLTIDQVKAGGNIGIGSDTDIIIPHDRDDYNIAAGGDVTLKAGDNILNGGGDKWAIKVGDGHTLDVTANMNEKNDGRIGKLPYTDMRTSLNVDAYVGDINVIKDEVGLTDLIGNIRLKTRPVDPEPDNSSALSLDDRDHRYSINEDDEPTVNHHRQALRYNVASSDYVLMNSQSDSGAKVQNVIDISKQGMLVKTDTTPQMGENVSITMDYKGLPFTVDGQVVRVNPENNTAGVAFTNVDQLTSSMILYLGMSKGQP